jgi:hypothetical protein
VIADFAKWRTRNGLSYFWLPPTTVRSGHSGKHMLHLLSAEANARLFGLDLGDWSVLLGGSIFAALVLFLN